MIHVNEFFWSSDSKEILKGTYLFNVNTKKRKEDKDINELMSKNIEMLKKRLYVLLTRGRKSTHIYCEDNELREYLKSHIIKI